MTDSVNKQDVNVNHEDNDGSDSSTESIIITNPLVQRLKWHNELYRRIKLLPWWIKYNIGLAEAAVLKRSILKLASGIGFQDR